VDAKTRQILDELRLKSQMTTARGVVSKVNDDEDLQEIQVHLLAGELRDGLERFQNYGFSSYPHVGSEAATVFIGGNRDHGLVLAVDDRRYRFKVNEEGEIALYTDEGDYIYFKRGNEIEINTGTLTVNASASCTFNSPQFTVNSNDISLNGDVSVDGQLTSTGDITDNAGVNTKTMSDFRDTFNTHNHPYDDGTTNIPNQQV